MQTIYLPGWLNQAKNLEPLAELVGGDSQLIDLPSDAVRGIADFADWVAARITAPVWLVGHSFGGKIAIAVAALHPEKVKGIVVIAGSNRGRLIFRLLRPAIKLAKFLGFSGERFRAADYKNSSGIMKANMRKTLDFNIAPLARRMKCPAVLIYGGNDAVTPPALGRKLAAQIPGARFFRLDGFNHNSIITDGIYQASAIIKNACNQK
jgi:pimeloyl-ACP methyl ester carboxylesterase